MSQFVGGYRVKTRIGYQDQIDLAYIGSALVNASGTLAFFRRLDLIRKISEVLVGEKLGLFAGLRIYKPAFRIAHRNGQTLHKSRKTESPEGFDASNPEDFEEILRRGARYFASLKPGVLTEDIIEKSDPLEVRRSLRELIRRRVEGDFRQMFIAHGPNKIRNRLFSELDKVNRDEKEDDEERKELLAAQNKPEAIEPPAKSNVLPFSIPTGAAAVRKPETYFDQFKD